MGSRRSKHRSNQPTNFLYFGDSELDNLIEWDDIDVDVETGEEIIALVKKLQAIAPHIRWRIRWREHELGNYQVLTVPTEQFSEAEFILELWKKGENLDKYCTEWMYPELYVVVNGKAVLRQEIAAFINLAKEFRFIWEGTNNDLQELFLRLSILLPQLYTAALNLPIISCDAARYLDLEYEIDDFCQEILPKNWPNFGKFEKYYAIDAPYGSTDALDKTIMIVERNLSKDLWELYNILERGLVFFDEKDLEGMLCAVAYWRNEFDWTCGWGYRLLQILSALHHVLEVHVIESRLLDSY